MAEGAAEGAEGAEKGCALWPNAGGTSPADPLEKGGEVDAAVEAAAGAAGSAGVDVVVMSPRMAAECPDRVNAGADAG